MVAASTITVGDRLKLTIQPPGSRGITFKPRVWPVAYAGCPAVGAVTTVVP
jgi:hypothetical protein